MIVWISVPAHVAERRGGQAMWNVGEDTLETMERLYPGIRKTVEYYESLHLPHCATCASEDTAKVRAGTSSRSIHALVRRRRCISDRTAIRRTTSATRAGSTSTCSRLPERTSYA